MLTQLHNRQIVVRAKSKRRWISAPGELPWFLKPLRPQGFLGRQYLQLRPDFPNDPDIWTAEQALYIAANHAADPPGAFGLGGIMGRWVPEAPREIGARALHYDRSAAAIGTTLPVGSSAGGEQPKFLTELADSSCTTISSSSSPRLATRSLESGGVRCCIWNISRKRF